MHRKTESLQANSYKLWLETLKNSIEKIAITNKIQHFLNWIAEMRNEQNHCRRLFRKKRRQLNELLICSVIFFSFEYKLFWFYVIFFALVEVQISNVFCVILFTITLYKIRVRRRARTLLITCNRNFAKMCELLLLISFIISQWSWNSEYIRFQIRWMQREQKGLNIHNAAVNITQALLNAK